MTPPLPCHLEFTAFYGHNQNHLVIGGRINHLKQLQQELPQYKAKQSQLLNIQLPSHTAFYQDKKGQFQSFLASTGLNTLRYPLFSPLNLMKVYDALEEQKLLDEELYTCIEWNKVCELIKEYQYDLIIDLGPGQSMTSFLNLDSNNLNIITASQYKNIEGLIKMVLSQVILN